MFSQGLVMFDETRCADVEKTAKSDIEAAAGMVVVRLHGLYYKWDQWSYTLMNVADCMSGAKSFFTKSGAPKGVKKTVEDSMTVLPSSLRPVRSGSATCATWHACRHRDGLW